MRGKTRSVTVSEFVGFQDYRRHGHQGSFDGPVRTRNKGGRHLRPPTASVADSGEGSPSPRDAPLPLASPTSRVARGAEQVGVEGSPQQVLVWVPIRAAEWPERVRRPRVVPLELVRRRPPRVCRQPPAPQRAAPHEPLPRVQDLLRVAEPTPRGAPFPDSLTSYDRDAPSPALLG